jgi:hypothetical protein
MGRKTTSSPSEVVSELITAPYSLAYTEYAKRTTLGAYLTRNYYLRTVLTFSFWAGDEVTFCPRFFQEGSLQYINERTKQLHRPQDIGALQTYEQTIIHEWMHCKKAGMVWQSKTCPKSVNDLTI